MACRRHRGWPFAREISRGVIAQANGLFFAAGTDRPTPRRIGRRTWECAMAGSCGDRRRHRARYSLWCCRSAMHAIALIGRAIAGRRVPTMRRSSLLRAPEPFGGGGFIKGRGPSRGLAARRGCRLSALFSCGPGHESTWLYIDYMVVRAAQLSGARLTTDLRVGVRARCGPRRRRDSPRATYSGVYTPPLYCGRRHASGWCVFVHAQWLFVASAGSSRCYSTSCHLLET